METRKIVLLAMFPFIVFLHICNNFVIVWKQKLHSPVYYVLMNLSLSDIVTLIIVIIKHQVVIEHHLLVTSLNLLHTISISASVFFTFALTVERFIAVR